MTDTASTGTAPDTGSAGTGGNTSGTSNPTNPTTPTGNTPETGATGANAPAGQSTGQSTDWKQHFSPEYQDNPHIAKYFNGNPKKGFDELAKGHLNLTSKIGAGRITKPTENSPPEEWRSFYKEIGVPEKPEDYFDGVEGFDSNDPMFGKYAKIAHEKGAPKSVIQEIFKETLKDTLAMREQQAQKLQEDSDKYVAKHVTEAWGDKFEVNMNLANRAYTQVLSPELQQRLKLRGMNSDPDVVHIMYEVAQRLGEDTVGDPTSSGLNTAASAKERADKMLMDTNHPLNNKRDPRHKAAVEEYSKLRAQSGAR